MENISDFGLTLPEWEVSTWLNTPNPISLQSLRGRVVMLHTFQMLCPGCVSHGLPQAERVQKAFSAADLVVVGLHTVFEHHDAMKVDALRAFVHEYRWSFPIGVDKPDGRRGPSVTMSRYGLHGTPSCVVLDREGKVRLHHFGRLDDLALGYVLGGLVAERPDEGVRRPYESATTAVYPTGAACSSSACPVSEAAG